jgi:hypothetical protein
MMARIGEVPAKAERAWKRWVRGRPPNVRAVAERFDPWSLYRMKSTGQRVTVESFSAHEDGRVTLTVLVSGEFNLVAFERQVFGIDPNDLEPCELLSANDPVGSVLTTEQVAENRDALRVMVRPDLWVMGPDGRAVRRQPL